MGVLGSWIRFNKLQTTTLASFDSDIGPPRRFCPIWRRPHPLAKPKLLANQHCTLGDHFKSGQRLSVQNRPTEGAGPGPVCSTLPAPVEASRFWCASFADRT